MTDLPFVVDRDVLIHARVATVFRFFTDSALFARWWGAGSTIEPRAGGVVRIVYPNAAVASGVVQEIVPGRSIVFSYGYEGAGKPIAPGARACHGMMTLAEFTEAVRNFDISSQTSERDTS